MNQSLIPKGLRSLIAASALAHVAVVLLVVYGGRLAARTAPPPQAVLVTKLVRLGKERPKHLLPRKETPPPPPAKPVSVPTPDAPKPSPTPPMPSAKDRIAQLSQVSKALERLKHQKPEELDGHPDGVPEGEVSDLQKAILGSKFGTEVEGCLRDNFVIQGLDRERVRGLDAVVVVRVAPDGRFIDHSLKRGSGMPVFDRATERAIVACGKVSPPPKELASDLRETGIEVTFKPF